MEEGIQVQPPTLKAKSPTAHLDVLRSAREGRKDLLEAFLDDNVTDALEYNMSSPKYAGYAVLGACSGGCNEVLDWLAERSIYATNYGGISVRAAAAGGHVTTLEWLKEHGVDMHHGGIAALSRAAENGHIAVLEWLEQEGLSLEAAGPELAQSSARRLDMLKWMDHKLGREWTKQHALQAFIGAAEHGSVDVLEWLRRRILSPSRREKQAYKDDACFQTPDVFLAAVRANQLSTLEWLERKGFLAYQNGKEGIKEATVLGHHEIAQWIRDRNCFAPQSCFGIWWAKWCKRSHAAAPKEEKDISEDDDALIEAV